ncbi:MAG: hypothetical protein AAF802_23920 [Planctomycetota bacterium]
MQTTIGKLLGLAGCFAITFALITYGEVHGWGLLWFAVPSLIGGLHGTYKKGLAGFAEGAFYGALLFPVYFACFLVLAVLFYPFSIVFGWAASTP